MFDQISNLFADFTERSAVTGVIFLGFPFFFFMCIYMLYLRPITRLDKVITYFTGSMALFFGRIIQQRLIHSNNGTLTLFAAFVWLNLIVSYFVVWLVIIGGGFGKKGVRKVLPKWLSTLYCAIVSKSKWCTERLRKRNATPNNR